MFLIKIESTWRCKIKEQAPQLTLLYRGSTVRSSHLRCCIRRLFLKILPYSQETLVLESIFKNIADLQTCNFIKKGPQHWYFPGNIAKFLILLMPTFFEKHLQMAAFYFFNGSHLHGPKGLRSRFYEGIRLQGLSHRSSFCF